MVPLARLLAALIAGPLCLTRVLSGTVTPIAAARGRDQVLVRHPDSGLVMALEPVMPACSGVWVAHGGSADRAASDPRGRVAIAGGVSYWLRRIWRTAEEERGYNCGFANEALSPLCHLAHAQPVFRRADWAHYRAVNLILRVGANKGTALQRLRADLARATAIYVGDDDTDEDAFALAPSDQLLPIRVGNARASRARYRLESQADIDKLLRTLLAMRAPRSATFDRFRAR